MNNFYLSKKIMNLENICYTHNLENFFKISPFLLINEKEELNKILVGSLIYSCNYISNNLDKFFSVYNLIIRSMLIQIDSLEHKPKLLYFLYIYLT